MNPEQKKAYRKYWMFGATVSCKQLYHMQVDIH
jgi:hypothetical protein